MRELGDYIETELVALETSRSHIDDLQRSLDDLEESIWSGENSYLNNMLIELNSR